MAIPAFTREFLRTWLCSLGATMGLSSIIATAQGAETISPETEPKCVQPGQGAQIVPTRKFDLVRPNRGTRVLLNPLNPNNSGTLTMLSLGDSAMWGNGLRNEHKYSLRVAQQVADWTQRSVQLTTYAHSGADLAAEADQLYEPLIASDAGTPPGDLNAGLPTTKQQESCAAEKYPEAEIVLLDGCINDVSALKIALPFPFSGASEDEIRKRAYNNCSNNMLSLLESTKADFPKATVIVSNYWLIISDKSSPAGVTILGARAKGNSSDHTSNIEFEKLLEVQRKAEAETGENFVEEDLAASPSTIFRKWSANSRAFLDVSQGCFKWAVSVADGQTAKSVLSAGAQPAMCPKVEAALPEVATQDSRVFLAVVSDDARYSYGAGKLKRLWSVPVGPFRRDEMFKRRGGLCATHYEKNSNRFICSVNATAHPNLAGANAYTQSISSVMKRAWTQP